MILINKDKLDSWEIEENRSFVSLKKFW